MPKQVFSTIMLLAEGTDAGMEAARLAISLAANEGAPLHIVSVVDTHTLKQLLSYRILLPDEMVEYERALVDSSRKHLDYVAQLATKAKVEHHSTLLTGACHTSVLHEQRIANASLLVMGTFHASTVKTDLIGREKQLIIDEIPCPVLLAPAARR